MYKEHPVFIQRENEEIKVWRYMDFTKFISLIDTRRLFFTRADKFEDPFEGSWPKINVEARKEIPGGLHPESEQRYLELVAKVGKFNEEWRKFIAVNCWHANEYESSAMWKLYLKSDEGIAIQSTYKRLKKSIIDEENVFIGQVKYIDYEKEFIDAGNLYGPFVHKRKSFEHEREIRGVVVRWPKHKKDDHLVGEETIEGGIPIKTDLEMLIENIYISPNAPNWLAQLVESAINRYGYNFKIIHSTINASPMF